MSMQQVIAEDRESRLKRFNRRFYRVESSRWLLILAFAGLLYMAFQPVVVSHFEKVSAPDWEA